MNTRNNRRALKSQETIEKAYIQLLDMHDTMKITVKSICELAKVNRSTFYAHYTDVFDLEKKIEEKWSIQLKEIFEAASHDKTKIYDAFCGMFHFIREHKVFYKVFLKYNNLTVLKTILTATDTEASDRDHNNYHISFFTAGVSEMIRIWLNNNCQEKPEEMAQIIYEEYRCV